MTNEKMISFEDLKFEQMGPAHFAIEMPVDRDQKARCEYWKVPNARGDEWRFKLSGRRAPLTGDVDDNIYSHLNADGCKIAIFHHYVNLGVITYPLDNSHLSNLDFHRVLQTERAKAEIETPQVGDFVILPEGPRMRIGEINKHRNIGLTKALEHSFYCDYRLTTYSGGFNNWEYVPADLTDSGEKKHARFWFFRDRQSGPGRGVDYFVKVRVWHIAL